MRAMLIHSYGAPEVLHLGEIETPQPRRGEVLVRVRASSVNPVDAAIRAGMLKHFVRLRLPAVLGVDVAGEVAGLGEGVRRFAFGDRVYAFTGIRHGGGYGEYTAIPERMLALIPKVLDWAQAGTVPGVGVTAYEAFTVQAPLKAGMRVFINGAAGGVGTYAVQMAKARGTAITATCSGAKADLVRDLGADRVIDYTTEDPFAATNSSYDVVLNAVRGAPLARLRGLLRQGGSLITITADHPGQILTSWLRNLFSSRRTIPFFVKTSGALLEGLSRLIEQGKVRPIVERTYHWHELAAAHRHIETGHVTGKLAILAPAAEGA